MLFPFTKTLPPSIRPRILFLELPKARAMTLSSLGEATVPETSSLLGVGRGSSSRSRRAWTEV